jgi:hypothetical protein
VSDCDASNAAKRSEREAGRKGNASKKNLKKRC